MARGIIESLRANIASQELRASYFATTQNLYEFNIDLLMQMHRQRPSDGYDGLALEVSERGRARSLIDLLTEAGADIRQGVDPTLVERERSLQQQLNAAARRKMLPQGDPDTEEQTQAIAKEIDALTTDEIELRVGLGVAEMRIFVDGRATDEEVYLAGAQSSQPPLRTGQCVVDDKLSRHPGHEHSFLNHLRVRLHAAHPNGYRHRRLGPDEWGFWYPPK